MYLKIGHYAILKNNKITDITYKYLNNRRIRCIVDSDRILKTVTLDKSYLITDMCNNLIQVVTNDGVPRTFNKSRFECMSEKTIKILTITKNFKKGKILKY